MKEFAKYMRIGKTVKSAWTGEVYRLIEDMDGKENVKGVSLTNWNRYNLLKAWAKNWENKACRERFIKQGMDIEKIKGEMQDYVEELKISDVEPHDKIRFITPDYKTKFMATGLSLVSVNGTAARVAYLDEYHFTFTDKNSMNLYGGCFHICQFAELCEKNGVEVKPIQ